MEKEINYLKFKFKKANFLEKIQKIFFISKGRRETIE